MRHAKSSWEEAALDDHDRPLLERGRDAARAVGRAVRAKLGELDVVVCSSAVRALQTWDALESTAETGLEPEIDGDVYHASGPELLERVRRLPEGAGTALMIGHNPGFVDVIAELVSETRGRAARRMRRGLLTSSLAVIDLDTARWTEVAPGDGTLRMLLRPKDGR